MGFAKNRLKKSYKPNFYKEAPKRALSREDRIPVHFGGIPPTIAAPGGIMGIGVAVLALVCSARGAASGRHPAGLVLLALLLADRRSLSSDGFATIPKLLDGMVEVRRREKTTITTRGSTVVRSWTRWMTSRRPSRVLFLLRMRPPQR